MHNKINFCLVLLSKKEKEHFKKMAENQVNHKSENKNIP
jgi:hypothetical protein